jgi:hypothetical protein
MSMSHARTCLLATALLVWPAAASAPDPSAGPPADPPLTAAQSNPKAMGWMQGSPPPPDRRITQPDSVYFSFPKLRWSVCHLRQLLPTIGISRGLGAPLPLAYANDAERARLQQGIDALTFEPLDGRPPMTWAQSLAANSPTASWCSIATAWCTSATPAAWPRTACMQPCR